MKKYKVRLVEQINRKINIKLSITELSYLAFDVRKKIVELKEMGKPEKAEVVEEIRVRQLKSYRNISKKIKRALKI